MVKIFLDTNIVMDFLEKKCSNLADFISIAHPSLKVISHDEFFAWYETSSGKTPLHSTT